MEREHSWVGYWAHSIQSLTSLPANWRCNHVDYRKFLKIKDSCDAGVLLSLKEVIFHSLGPVKMGSSWMRLRRGWVKKSDGGVWGASSLRILLKINIPNKQERPTLIQNTINRSLLWLWCFIYEGCAGWGCDVWVVKELDLKSNGSSPCRFIILLSAFRTVVIS